MTALPEEAFGAALAGLPGMGPHRLLELLTGTPPSTAWQQFGRPDADVVAVWDRVHELGLTVGLVGSPGYPKKLAKDQEPPAVLFWRGSIKALEGPRVAIVGTRRCTHYGREVASHLGAELSRAGVVVISGLALGIDGAAHEGALAGHADDGRAPVGVVGSGLDVVYPRRHSRLWGRVAAAGCLMSEAPPGAAPEPWRFPARNRIIAALADLVVVVESHAAGGSMLTVDAAIKRDCPVMAVPGSVRSPSSAGTNKLLTEGIPPVLDADDVLCALGLEGVVVQPLKAAVIDVEGAHGDVLAAVEWSPTGVETVMRRTGLGLPATAAALGRLEDAGLVRKDGPWWQRSA
jgi:DNA processing protein